MSGHTDPRSRHQDIADQQVLKIGGADGMVRVRTIVDPADIPSIVFFSVPTHVETVAGEPGIEVKILSYYTLASARQRLREMGELT